MPPHPTAAPDPSVAEIDECIEGFFSGACSSHAVGGMLEGAGIEGRSDLICSHLAKEVMAEMILKDYRDFMRNPAKLLGYDPFDGCFDDEDDL